MESKETSIKLFLLKKNKKEKGGKKELFNLLSA
jgi:hypothetical protein